MSRRILPVLFALLLIVLIALPGQSAPAPKEIEQPLPPISAAMRLKATNNLKIVGLAMHNYHDTNGTLPTNLLSKDGKPGLSWRVAILPYIEEDTLYKQFKLDEPWDSEHNLKLAEKLPKIYMPVRGKAEKGQTFLQMFNGEGTMLESSGKALALTDITDGLSNTIMVVEGGKAVTWTKPSDLPFDGKKLPELGGMFDGEITTLMGDGSVKRLPKGIDAKVLMESITRAGGEVTNLDEAIEAARAKE